ncbi:MAG: hypothetical protein AAF443_08255 [Chlamydiota bacterium]
MSSSTYFHSLQWKTPLFSKGVLTGANEAQEWMLPHWWSQYTAASEEPVTFIDFGMSVSARNWCAKKGKVVTCSLPVGSIKKRDAISSVTAKFWERVYPGNLWAARHIWFAKPLAFMQTRYQWNLWLDLDCEVKKPLSDFFTLADNRSGLAVAPTTPALQKASRITGLLKPGEQAYNPGVVVFRHKSPAILKWAELSLYRNEEFLGDENSLSRALLEGQFKVTALPLIYNWPFFYGKNPAAKIVHFFTASGKQALTKKIFKNLT